MPKTLGPHAGGSGKGIGLWAQTPIIPAISGTVYSGSAAFAGAGGLFANDRFSPGKYDETGEVASLSFPADFLTELEYGLDLDLDTLYQGDVLRFRVYVNGVALDLYSATPTVTIPAHAFNAVAVFGGSGNLSANATLLPKFTSATLAGTGTLVAATSHFSAGRYDETGEAASLGIAVDAFTEIEFGLRLDLDTLTTGDTLRFRVYVNGVALDVYSITPTITVAAHAITALAAFVGTGNLSAQARLKLPALASFAGTGNLSALATQRLRASVVFAGAGNFSADAIRRMPALATFAGSGSLTADATVIVGGNVLSGSATFNGAGNLSASASLLRMTASAVFNGTGNFSQNAIRITPAVAAFNGAGNQSALAALILNVPEPSLSDFFNRVDGPLGANWTNTTSLGIPQIVANAYVITTTPNTHGIAYWSANNFPSDHYSQIKRAGATGNFCGPVVRHQVGSSSFYLGLTITTTTARIYRCDSGSFTQLGADIAVSPAMIQGDLIRLRAVGSTLTLSVNGTDMGARTDATYTGGYPGIDSYDINVDDFLAGPLSLFAGAGDLAASATIAVGGNVLSGSAAFSGAGNLSALAALRLVASASFVGVGNFSADAMRIAPATVNFAGTGNLSALAVLRLTTSAAFVGAGNLSTLALLRMNATATFAGSGNLNSDAIRFIPAIAAFNGVGNLSALAQLLLPASASFAGVGSLAATAQLRSPAIITFNGAGDLSVAARLRMVAAATFNGIGNLDAFATIAGAVNTYAGSALLTGTGNLSATAKLTLAASATYAGTGALSATANQRLAAIVSFNGLGAFSADSIKFISAAAAFNGTGSLTASITLVLSSAATFAGTGNFAISAGLRLPALATFTGTGSLTGDLSSPLNIFSGSALLTGAGSLNVAARQRMVAFVSLPGAGDLSVSARQRLLAFATFAGIGDANVDAGLRKPIGATFAGTGAFVASAIRVINNAATFAGTGSLTASALPLRGISALFAGAGNLNAAADKRTFISVSFAGSGNVNVGTIHKMVATALFAGEGQLSAQSSLQVSADNIIKVVRVGITHNAPRTTVTIKATKVVRVGITHNAPRTTVTIKATAHQVGVLAKARPSVVVDWPKKRVA